MSTKNKVERPELVCANCHRMLHWGGHVRSIDELRALIKSHPARLRFEPSTQRWWNKPLVEYHGQTLPAELAILFPS